jgi:two-component system chemotaxis response regulator CheY
VEDSSLVRKMYGLVFSRREHELTLVSNGVEALKILDRSDTAYDLILLDLNMPDMNGVEFIREVRGNPAASRIPIVLTTAEPEGSVLMIQARALGVAGVVRKPWKPQEVKDLVQLAVKRHVA